MQLFKSHNLNQPQLEFDWNIANLDIIKMPLSDTELKAKLLMGNIRNFDLNNYLFHIINTFYKVSLLVI